MDVTRWDPQRDGRLSEAALRHKLEDMGYRVTVYRYPPATYFGPHTHEVDKMDAVLSGRLRFTMAGESVLLEQGDIIHVPRHVVHSAEVVGSETVVSLDAVKMK